MNLERVAFTNLSLHIKFCRYCRHDETWSERKTKMDYTLWNIQKGSLVMEINRRQFAAHKGDVILFYPGDTGKHPALCERNCYRSGPFVKLFVFSHEIHYTENE